MSAITISEERGVRYLHFGSPLIQGAMRIARPWSLELDYTRAMMMPLLFHPEPRWPRRALQIGLGAASITKFLYRHKTHATLTVVEIAPEVVTAAWQFFSLPDDPKRLTVEIDDGHAYTSTVTRRFNLILVDGFDAKGRAGMLDSVPFYRNCRARLADDGMIAINLLSKRRGADQSIARIRDAFDDRVLALPPCDAGNIVALAVVGAPVRISIGELRAAAQKLKIETALNLLPMLARLATRVGAVDVEL
ncbi:MAG TPA: fused MFS/spermidine synthase [Casimicrobiaceae bacterium]|jgi:spermidine synthase